MRSSKTHEQAEQIVQRSIDELLRRDSILLTNDVSERAITHKLAQYIQGEVERLQINDVQVDCEYNRNLGVGQLAPKRIQLLVNERRNQLRMQGELSEDEFGSLTTFPDIIVHGRGHNRRNLLVIEVKKTTNEKGDTFDLEKLRAFTEQTDQNSYHFTHGLILKLTTGQDQMQLPELRWFSEGHER